MPSSVVNLLERDTYAMAQVDRILCLPGGTARRWIDGYERAGRRYPPVVREEPTGSDVVTWGEFVETRLLSEYRDRGVPLIKMRPAIEKLREELGSYPLASSRMWLDVEGQELVRRAQEDVALDPLLALVEVRTGQSVIDWTKPADDFRRSIEWTAANGQPPQPKLLRPYADIKDVVVNPVRGFGEPVVHNRNVRTDIIAELIRAGDSPDMIAEQYELRPRQVQAAVQYELRRAA